VIVVRQHTTSATNTKSKDLNFHVNTEKRLRWKCYYAKKLSLLRAKNSLIRGNKMKIKQDYSQGINEINNAQQNERRIARIGIVSIFLLMIILSLFAEG
jgi:hypothetical protein